MSSRQIAYRVLAIGSTDAVGRAKETARAEGHRIQTVASVRQEGGPTATARREQAAWIVTLAVRA